MRIAMIAHDKKKEEMIVFSQKYETVLEQHHLVATGTTGHRIMENTSLKILCLKSGPLGGDQEIGAMVANQQVDLIFFFRDPLTAQPHEPDVSALLRLCDVYQIPLATNRHSAEYFMNTLERL